MLALVVCCDVALEAEADKQSTLCLCPRPPRAVPPLVHGRLEFTVFLISLSTRAIVNCHYGVHFLSEQAAQFLVGVPLPHSIGAGGGAGNGI
ncbi:hypothetical protein Y032_0057g2813 [Ancylostoma ceylanicum]|uniref:Uncharacterized protein n=1 Tax=Ancylostoma ceylanicum TaxID=53326 RepID=A0A016U6H6_9BILA|nr:hypothetical protein Y032_0057g2813 [Ancylostoma ceylanicum]